MKLKVFTLLILLTVSFGFASQSYAQNSIQATNSRTDDPDGGPYSTGTVDAVPQPGFATDDPGGGPYIPGTATDDPWGEGVDTKVAEEPEEEDTPEFVDTPVVEPMDDPENLEPEFQTEEEEIAWEIQGSGCSSSLIPGGSLSGSASGLAFLLMGLLPLALGKFKRS